MSMQENNLINSIIQKIATGPELSKDIDVKDCENITTAILNNEIDDVQTAIFFIALRMKRETIDENIGVLLAVLKAIKTVDTTVDTLLNIGEPYSGYDKSIPISSFLPILLAEIGLPTIIHGVDRVGPKFGITHRHINKALNNNVDISVIEAKKQIECSDKGWAYIDQKIYCNKLYKLISLRNKIVKRTIINTIESIVNPIKANQTHSILGYVHKPYIPIYATLANKAGFTGSLIIKGVEGGIVPSLRQKSLVTSYTDKQQIRQLEVEPNKIGINSNLRAITIAKNINIYKNEKELIKYIIDLGSAALSGEKGMFYDGLVYSASLILWHLQKFQNIYDAADFVRTVLDSGKAVDRI